MKTLTIYQNKKTLNLTISATIWAKENIVPYKVVVSAEDLFHTGGKIIEKSFSQMYKYANTRTLKACEKFFNKYAN